MKGFCGVWERFCIKEITLIQLEIGHHILLILYQDITFGPVSLFTVFICSLTLPADGVAFGKLLSKIMALNERNICWFFMKLRLATLNYLIFDVVRIRPLLNNHP